MARLVFLGCIAYLVTGLGQLVLGAVMEPMVHEYGVRYGDGGQLVMNQFLGGLLGVVCIPLLMRRFGQKGVLLFSLTLIAVSEAVYTLLPSWGVMLAVAPVAGFGLGATEAVVGSLIIGAAGAKANTAMSRVETFFGVGALLMPFAGAALIEAGSWRLAFAIVGVLSAATLLLWSLLWRSAAAGAASDHAAVSASAEPAAAGVHGGPAPQADRRNSGAVVLAVCALFFAVYVGLEMSFVHYLPTLLVKESGLSEPTAALSLSLFWGAMVIGRIFAGQIADRIGGGTYLTVSCAVCAGLFILLGIFTGSAGTFTLAFLAGLTMSGMFAIALVFANRAVPGMTEKTTSLLIACGLTGGSLLPKLAGWMLDGYGPGAARWLFAAIAAALLALMLWATVAERSRTSRTAGATPAEQSC